MPDRLQGQFTSQGDQFNVLVEIAEAGETFLVESSLATTGDKIALPESNTITLVACSRNSWNIRPRMPNSWWYLLSHKNTPELL